MNLFGSPVEADGCRPQYVPFGCAVLLPFLRTRIGSSYSSFSNVILVFLGWLTATGLAAGAFETEKFSLWLDFALHTLVLLPLGYAAVRERVRTKVTELSRYTAVSRYYSGQPRITNCLPKLAGWLARLHDRSPVWAARVARWVYPLYRAQRWLDERPLWLLKAVFEPLFLLLVGGFCLLAWWLIELPVLFIGCHAALVAVILCWDQVTRSLALYEEVRANEEGAIVATQMAVRLMERREP